MRYIGVLNKEKIEDHHFLFRETLEEYIDNIGVGHLEDDARWLEVISSDGRLVEETIENILNNSTSMTRKILEKDYIKPVNTRLARLKYV